MFRLGRGTRQQQAGLVGQLSGLLRNQHRFQEGAGKLHSDWSSGFQTREYQVPEPSQGSRTTDLEVQEILPQGSRTAHQGARASGSGIPDPHTMAFCRSRTMPRGSEAKVQEGRVP